MKKSKSKSQRGSEMSPRKFYRTVIQIEVLSEDPIPDGMDLSEIVYQIKDGDWSARVAYKPHKELDARQTVRLLRKQGSDPSFFRLTKHGKDCDEE